MLSKCAAAKRGKEKGNSGNDGRGESVMCNDGVQLAGDIAL